MRRFLRRFTVLRPYFMDKNVFFYNNLTEMNDFLPNW